ncbi:AAA family ATPase [Streptomyces sp. NBC_01451]|uniref:AAA family ATPase n=1 Tax=Streptomyces sp. NBC_01451 TaxID=2903872 RepID=UPI002E3624C3|nr:AAA family ATPase [Streptomyces sp. NBC_01451]
MSIEPQGSSELPQSEINARLALWWLLNPEAAPLESFNEDVQRLVSVLSAKLPATNADDRTQALIEAQRREAAELDKAKEIASFNRAKERALTLEEETQRAQVSAMVDALMSETLTTQGLDDIEELSPVVDGLLYRSTVARINGRPGTMKSFVALDIAGCVANGLSWAGRDVTKGEVIYLVAEGAGGIKKRVRAWEQEHGCRMDGVRFLPRPIQVSGIEWLVLEEACKRLRPALVVVDTQARATVGIEESSNERMSVIFNRIERLARESEACATLVHHTGHAGEHGRGASNMLGAVQTELLIKKEGKGADRVISIRIDKTKDDDDSQEIRLLPRVVAVQGMYRKNGAQETSVVLVPERQAVFSVPGLDPAVSHAVQMLDKHNAPMDLGRDRMRAWLTDRQIAIGNTVLAPAIAYRKKREAARQPETDAQVMSVELQLPEGEKYGE